MCIEYNRGGEVSLCSNLIQQIYNLATLWYLTEATSTPPHWNEINDTSLNYWFESLLSLHITSLHVLHHIWLVSLVSLWLFMEELYWSLVYLCFQLHVYVTHLSLSQKARERSVVEIWKHMSQHSGPAVLMGDLNAQPDSPEYKWVFNEQGLYTKLEILIWQTFERFVMFSSLYE